MGTASSHYGDTIKSSSVDNCRLPMRHVIVEEVIGRVQQGRTEPFLCRCDDGATYVVKGRSAGRSSLCAEVICAHLATFLGIPVPESVIVQVPSELVRAGRDVGLPLNDLGSGPAFGSRHVKAVEFTIAHRELVHVETAQAVAVFDWWIGNEDRVLTPLGGNVNLLWSVPPDEALVVIDHNLAFAELNKPLFLGTHVFAEQLNDVSANYILRDQWTNVLQNALTQWIPAINQVPEEWAFIDEEMTVPSNVPLQEWRAILERCNAENFWDLT